MRAPRCRSAKLCAVTVAATVVGGIGRKRPVVRTSRSHVSREEWVTADLSGRGLSGSHPKGPGFESLRAHQIPDTAAGSRDPAACIPADIPSVRGSCGSASSSSLAPRLRPALGRAVTAPCVAERRCTGRCSAGCLEVIVHCDVPLAPSSPGVTGRGTRCFRGDHPPLGVPLPPFASCCRPLAPGGALSSGTRRERMTGKDKD